ncbi:MAG: FAD-dependent monooxygenase, partial [Parvibaculum sp.]|nr:FAD-dependent monooxygenase [Parvibaculum sp.]
MTRTPVLIVGAGPVGQLSALLLAHHGIASRLIDRRPHPTSAPKAHAVNPRT